MECTDDEDSIRSIRRERRRECSDNIARAVTRKIPVVGKTGTVCPSPTDLTDRPTPVPTPTVVHHTAPQKPAPHFEWMPGWRLWDSAWRLCFHITGHDIEYTEYVNERTLRDLSVIENVARRCPEQMAAVDERNPTPRTRVLLLGAGGFIGCHLTERMLKVRIHSYYGPENKMICRRQGWRCVSSRPTIGRAHV